MNERITELRKVLGLTMKEFGQRIGLTDAMVSRMESGKNEPTGRTVLSICREFGVSEDWLRSGAGEMFAQDHESILDRLAREYRLTPEERVMVTSFLNLDAPTRAAVMRYVRDLADSLSKLEPPPETAEEKAARLERENEELRAALNASLKEERKELLPQTSSRVPT